jgi:Tol biopolymer transport system component
MQDGRIQPLPPEPSGLHPAMSAWSPDGTMLAGELRNQPGIAVYTLADKTYRRLTPGGAHPIWLPGGKELLYSDGPRLRIVDVATGAIRPVMTALPISAMSLSNDGRTLVYSERNIGADVWMMDLR